MTIETSRSEEYPKTKRGTSSSWKEWALLFAVFVFSLIIRAIAVDYGFPMLTHPDEVFTIQPVIEMSVNKTLNSGTFNRPGQIMMLIDFICLNLTSYFRFGMSLVHTYSEHILTFYRDARLLVAVLGSFIPIVAYQIGKQFKTRFALPALFVFALFPSYVQHSVYLTPDIPITLFTLLVILFMLLYLNQKKDLLLYLAVLFAAINTAEKYPGLMSMAIVYGGILINTIENPTFSLKENWFDLVKKWALATFVFIAALFFIAPFLFIEIEKVIQSLLFEARSTHAGADNLGWGGNLIFYIKSFTSWTNILSLLFIALGVYSLIRKREKTLFLLLYGLIYWVIMSKLSLHWERWALPMYITPLFLIAVGITCVWCFSKEKMFLKYAAILVTSGFFLYQAIFTVYTPINMSFPDTRVVALDFCRENNITAENTLFEGYSPFLPEGIQTIFDVEPGDAQGRDYIILSSGMYDRYFSDPERYGHRIRFYEAIRSEQKLIAKFEPDPQPASMLGRIEMVTYYMKAKLNHTEIICWQGPVIEIYGMIKTTSKE
ncbi:MAG: glycosyltransferase family 39 protein [Brevefilum sp.]|jgi:hypothetical protein